jgi:polysaccharide pyruvyl transferase WcaK-like protein
MRPARIVFYGNFGAGNLGNEVTLQTAIEHTFLRLPGAQLLCVCTNPADVRTRHNIEAEPSQSRGAGWSWSDLDAKPGNAGSGTATAGGSVSADHGRVLGRLGSACARAARIVFRRVPLEIAHWYRTLRLMARSDVFLVPGTGIITDAACGSLGWPYDMFKLAALARICGKRVIFLSVGAGPFQHRLGGWFIRQSLGLAHYRSYRDTDSKRRLEAIGFDTARDVVCPDLVFGLSSAHLGRRDGVPPQRTIALGLKDYDTPVDAADAQSYRDYLGVMADFVISVQAQGYAVRLIIGDAQFDTRVREDLIALLGSRGADVKPPLLLSEPLPTVAELLTQLHQTDVVISPRFHNLVLALMLAKPVIALSDLPKVTALLADLGLQRFCLSLGRLRTEELAGCFRRLQDEAARLIPYIGDATEQYRRLVEDQYAKVYADIAHAARLVSQPE